MKVLSLFADTLAARARALSEQIAKAKKRYCWWFDHPVEWERPTQTLYITGWCEPLPARKFVQFVSGAGVRNFWVITESNARTLAPPLNESGLPLQCLCKREENRT